MAERYQFKEVRKGEREAILAFAAEHGCAIKPIALMHSLSLTMQAQGEVIAAALSTRRQPGQIVIEIVVGKEPLDQSLLTELADRCLRKVQALNVASVRLHSPSPAPTETIWTQTNWLDHIEQTAPPEIATNEDESAQAA